MIFIYQNTESSPTGNPAVCYVSLFNLVKHAMYHADKESDILFQVLIFFQLLVTY